MPSERDFITLALGFFLPQEDADGPKCSFDLDRGSDWENLFAINLLCREGDFSKLNNVKDILLRSDDSLIWDAGVNILACAGGWNVVTCSLNHLRGLQHNEWVRYHLSALIGLSCDIRAVGPLVDLYSIATNPHEDRDQTLRELSYLLEPDDGAIFYSRHQDPSWESVAELVEPIRLSVADAIVGMKVLEAQTFDVVQLARRLLAKLRAEDAQSERFYRGLLIFEAATGVNCTNLFNAKDRLHRLGVVAVLEEFLEGESPSRFAPGIRYFFGHPIPD
jgi:hypothetical protein